jgi:hypothetical protein
MQTFVVRVYRPDGGEAVNPPELRGVVDEVASGASATFHGGDELLRILARQLEPRRRATGGQDER